MTAPTSPINPGLELTKQRAFMLFVTQIDFFTSRRGHGEVALIVMTPKERRFALVRPDEAAAIVEHHQPSGEARNQLRRDPSEVSGEANSFWLVAELGDFGWVYFPLVAHTLAVPTMMTTGSGGAN